MRVDAPLIDPAGERSCGELRSNSALRTHLICPAGETGRYCNPTYFDRCS